ncbi:hypothetical protein SAMN05660841_00195 [Sphingobacterium nematocida]|uniref:Uncharacterized protein n=1 Tax=Sphingobacterium nematocida TaxID=1513896 RepID=A0A1T5AUS8_9SPHI|nr:hypothetical protein SAMN05660841_00195 [Sphingobacterium nematocida]
MVLAFIPFWSQAQVNNVEIRSRQIVDSIQKEPDIAKKLLIYNNPLRASSYLGCRLC